MSHVQTEIKEEESGSPSTTSIVGVALKESHHASVQVEVENPRCSSVNVSIQKSAHAAVNVQSAVPGPSVVKANVLESPHTSVNIKFMKTFQVHETEIIEVDRDDNKSNTESQSISPSGLSTIAVEHNYSKNPVETPYAWLRFGKSFLTTLERDQINYGKQLTDKHINHAQNIIKSQFCIERLQLTLYQHTRKPPANKLQIIHSRNNHWLTASIIMSMSSHVDVYDSLHDHLDADSQKVILKLFDNGELQINMVKVQKQQGVDDSGLFAIANAVSLARKIDPTNVTYVQCQMRTHLINCFQECKMTSFTLSFKASIKSINCTNKLIKD